MLQYNVEAGAWTQIGTLQKNRGFHAITEVNFGAVGCVGNINPVKKENKIINIIITKLSVQIYLNLQLVILILINN